MNGEIKPLDYKIKNGDKISHAKHRHEIPVIGDKIDIIHEDNDYVVINKPCSIPMHPCGKYRYNSLNIILAKELGYKNLRTMYRLDRLTSGLVIMGKTFKSTLFIDRHIKDRTAAKTYVCKVDGEFPDSSENIVVNKGIDCASRKIGLYWIDDEKGKESITEFKRVSYNGSSSVVFCYPKTGRTHQIRIHLQYLGYPICNDPLYNQPTIWGPNNGKHGVYSFNKEEIESNFLKIHTYEAWIIKQEQFNEHDEESSNKNEDQNDFNKVQKIEEIKNEKNNDGEIVLLSTKRKNENLNSNDDEKESKKSKNEAQNECEVPVEKIIDTNTLEIKYPTLIQKN